MIPNGRGKGGSADGPGNEAGMTPISQFKVVEFRGAWWWFLFIRDHNGHETVIRRGIRRHENTALFHGLIAWAVYDLRRFMGRKPKGGQK